MTAGTAPAAPTHRAGRRFVALLAAVAVATLSLSSCGTDDDNDSRVATAGLPDLAQDLQAETWLLDAASTPAMTSDSSVTMRFDEDRISGTAPCNSFSAGYSLDDDSITIKAPISTRRACVDEAVTADEAAFLGALEKADTVDMDDDHKGFALTGDGVDLVFGAYDQRDGTEGAWTITGVATGDAIESPVPDTEPTITLTGDDVHVVTGCNDIVTSYTLVSDEISFEPVARTMKACVEPEGVERQEQAIADALEHAATVAVTPESLMLLGEDGKILLVGSRA